MTYKKMDEKSFTEWLQNWGDEKKLRGQENDEYNDGWQTKGMLFLKAQNEKNDVYESVLYQLIL